MELFSMLAAQQRAAHALPAPILVKMHQVPIYEMSSTQSLHHRQFIAAACRH
jgi:hypothetical protein